MKQNTSVFSETDHLDVTMVVDWEVKPQTKQN